MTNTTNPSTIYDESAMAARSVSAALRAVYDAAYAGDDTALDSALSAARRAGADMDRASDTVEWARYRASL